MCKQTFKHLGKFTVQTFFGHLDSLCAIVPILLWPFDSTLSGNQPIAYVGIKSVNGIAALGSLLTFNRCDK